MLPSIILKTKDPRLDDLKNLLFSLGLKKLKNNPDFKTIGENKNLKIKDIRDLKSYLQKKSFAQDTRVVLIKNAQLLNIQSQNALLKILEEPPQNTFLILVTAQPQSLLETIRSRCQTVTLNSRGDKTKKTSDQNYLTDLKQKSILEKLSWSQQNLKSIIDPEAYLEQQIKHFHNLLKKDPCPQNQHYLEVTTLALSFLKANLDFKTVLTWLILNLD